MADLKLNCPMPLQYDHIVMAHGGGGRLMQQLLAQIVQPSFANPFLNQQHDSAVLPFNGGKLAFTTDSYVIKPLFFPGGDIGKLAVCGTLNDLAMSGAKPLYISCSLIIEEGFAITDLQRIVDSMQKTAAAAGVPIVTGDTKVVERGKGDGVYINTAGIGVVAHGVDVAPRRAQVGDLVLLSGTIGDHGMAIMSLREGLAFETTIQSDSAALHTMVAALLAAVPDVHVMRDPTRGGVASALNEIAQDARVGIQIHAERVPVRSDVRSACELLGLDPLFVANEGKMLAIVPAAQADAALAAMRAHPLGSDAAIIGEVVDDHRGMLVERTGIGARRVITMQIGEQLPRIC